MEKQKADYRHVRKIIGSCKNREHLRTAKVLVENFKKLYGNNIPQSRSLNLKLLLCYSRINKN